MNNNDMLDKQEIDLLDFAISMLEQWRGWLLTGLICMLLLPGAIYAKDLRNYNSTPDTLEVNLSTEQIVTSSNPGVGLNYYIAWQQFKDSYDESLTMDLDATNIRRLNLEYFIDCSDGKGNAIIFLYTNLINDEAFISGISEAMGVDHDSSGAVSELINVSASNSSLENSTNNCGIVRFSIILPEGTEEDAVEKSVTSYLSSFSNIISARMGEHDVMLVSSGVTTSFDKTIVEQQSKAVSNIYSWKKAFFDLYKTLTEAERSEVDNVISKLTSGELSYQDVRRMYPAQSIVDVGSNGNAVVKESVVSAKPSFSKMYALLGFGIGIFLYVGCAFSVLILVRRFRNGEEAAELLSLRSYGNIYEYPYHGFMSFLHDKRIYRWRHKKTLNAIGVARAISAKADFSSDKKLTCLILGDVGKRGMTRLEEIAKKVSESGVAIELKKTPEGLDSISENEISGFSPVLITVVSGKTHPAKAAELLVRLKEYNIAVFGLNFIEV